MRKTNAKFFALVLAVLVCAGAARAQQQPDKKQTRPRTAPTPSATARG